MKTQLLCTFTKTKFLTKTVDKIIDRYDKQTNTLYTINALNECIKMCNNGVLDTRFQLEWDNYRNSILVTNDEGLRRIDTSVKEVIYIKVKK